MSSPLQSNVHLHEVLDVWFAQQVRPRLRGPATLVRYADDALMLFGNEADARKVLDVLHWHPDSTPHAEFLAEQRACVLADEESANERAILSIDSDHNQAG